MHSFIFELMEQHDFENIFFCQEKTLGLKEFKLFDSTGGPHSQRVPKFLRKPDPTAAIYNQPIIGMRISCLNGSGHHLARRWNNIPNP
ncbi:MAG TPA: hypothetical protein VJ761_11860 [Ktedonobacteraceae bacterium]|nr:hypothetical protein [Ktedonobacteraceae bacterium]